MYTDAETASETARSTSDPEVSGRILAVLPDAVERTCGAFDGSMRETMARAGIENPRAREWYDQARLLDVCDRLYESVGAATVERIGRFLPELVDWPADVTTTAEALEALDGWYDGLHRRGAGSVTFERTDDGHGEVRFETPYPDAFECGLVRGIGHHFETDDLHGYVTDVDTATGGVSRFVVR